MELRVCACVPGLSSSRYDCTSIPCTVPSAATDLSNSPQHTERQAEYQKGQLFCSARLCDCVIVLMYHPPSCISLTAVWPGDSSPTQVGPTGEPWVFCGNGESLRKTALRQQEQIYHLFKPSLYEQRAVNLRQEVMLHLCKAVQVFGG